ncbi:MAG TPA: ribosome maturation factor RimM [Hyphomicrobiaceae bacterium]|nr:ribosome maturation factor RimM [Hyphomicrobiaceae bacterium]
MSDKQILLGEITGAHGIRGEVLVRSYTGDPEAIGDYGALTDEKGASPLTLKVLRMTPKGAIVARIKGVVDRNGAEALKGRKLYVARQAMPEPNDEEDFYYADLIGLAAIDEAADALGKVIAVQNYGAGDLLEIRWHATGKSELIPFTKACVPRIDLVARQVIIALPELVEAEPPENLPQEST